VLLEAYVYRLIQGLVAASRTGEPVEMAAPLSDMSSDFATKAIFGRSTDSLLGQKTGMAAEFSRAANHAIHMLGKRGLMINLYWLIDSLRFRRSCRVCKNFVEHYLAEARQEPQPEKPLGVPDADQGASFMHSLLAKVDAHSELVRDQLLALLLASRDTSASFAAWVVYALARSPRVLAKLRGVVETRLPRGQLPTMADIAALPYLRHVLNESLRKYPVVPLDGRTARVDTVLPKGGGMDGESPLLVPAGTKVAFNIYSLHHRRDIFGEDAGDFKPERWEHGDFEGAFVPFITGPRVCLGSKCDPTNSFRTDIGAYMCLRKYGHDHGFVCDHPAPAAL
jgi:cytochrome P450